MNVLVINCGSSSLKFQLINSESEAVLAKGLCERIGIDGRLTYQKAGGEKEVTEAAMADAIDWSHFRKYGEMRIVKEKFVEDFTRRFSETVNINKTYNIKFYDIYEAPPKVSVKVTTKTENFTIFADTTSVDVVNKVDAVLEIKLK